jgi:putative ABC transport system substrate-binding protein
MRRRDVITGLAGAAMAPGVRAQQISKPRIGVLSSASTPQLGAFYEGLRESGFLVGQNVLIEFRSAEGNYERLPALAAELVGQSVDLIAAFGTPAVRVAKIASTKSVPVIPDCPMSFAQSDFVAAMKAVAKSWNGIATCYKEKLDQLISDIVPVPDLHKQVADDPAVKAAKQAYDEVYAAAYAAARKKL